MKMEVMKRKGYGAANDDMITWLEVCGTDKAGGWLQMFRVPMSPPILKPVSYPSISDTNIANGMGALN
jgi:hypothetical protein